MAGPHQGQNLYSADFLSVLAEQADSERRTRVAVPIRHLSDDARHAPTLLAGGFACLLITATATAFWIAIGAGAVAPSGKSGLPIIDIAEPAQPVAAEERQVAQRAALPGGPALPIAHLDALPRTTPLQALLDASLMHPPAPDQLGIVAAAQPAMHRMTPQVTKSSWVNQDETELSPVVARSTSIQPLRIPQFADPLPDSPASASVLFPTAAQSGRLRSGNEGWKDPSPSFMSAPIRTASFAGAVESPKRASDSAVSTQNATEPSEPSDAKSAQSGTAGSDVSGHSRGKKGAADSSTESAGANGGDRSSGKGKSDRGNGDTGTADTGSGPRGKGANGNGDQSGSHKGTGEKGTGDEAKGDKGKGDKGSGNKGKGDKGNGDKGKGGKGKGKDG